LKTGKVLATQGGEMDPLRLGLVTMWACQLEKTAAIGLGPRAGADPKPLPGPSRAWKRPEIEDLPAYPPPLRYPGCKAEVPKQSIAPTRQNIAPANRTYTWVFNTRFFDRPEIVAKWP